MLKDNKHLIHYVPHGINPETYKPLTKKDDTYKDLVGNEIIFIRRNKDKIYKNVELIYKQKAENDTSAGYVKSALNYKELEKLCDKYKA